MLGVLVGSYKYCMQSSTEGSIRVVQWAHRRFGLERATARTDAQAREKPLECIILEILGEAG